MSIPLECPACHHGFSVPESFEGKRGKCPKCGKVFTATAVEIPTFPEVPGEVPPPSPPASPEVGHFPLVSTGPKKRSGASLSDSGAIPVFPGVKKAAAPQIAPPPSGVGDSGSIPVFPATKTPAGPAVGVPIEPGKASDSGAIPVFPAVKKPAAVKPSDTVPAFKPLADSSQAMPAGKAVGGSSVQIGVSTGPHGVLHGQVTSRPKPSDNSPLALYAGLGGVALLALAVGLYFLLNSGSKPEKLTGGDTSGEAPPAAAPPEPGPKDPAPPRPGPAPAAPMARPVDPAVLQSVRTYALPGIVRIETLRGATREVGLGVVVDPRGWIATLYEVIQGATHVEVVFHGDQRVAVEGQAGLDLPHGLILLKVVEIPEGARFIGLHENEQVAGDPYFPTSLVGGQAEISASTLSAVVPRRRLDFTAEKALSGDLRGTDDLVFLELTTPVPREAAGGPLLDRAGFVAGICIPLGRDTKKGYAIDVQHLAKLIDGASGEVRPLDPTKIAGSDTPDPTDPTLPALPEKPAPAPMPMPEESQVAAAVRKLSALRAECRKQKFAAATAEEYARLQDLAATLGALELDAESTLRTDEDRAQAAAAVAAALDDLSDFVWPDVSGTNTRALEAASADPAKPVFVYATVRGRQENTFFLSLPGTGDQFIVIAVKENADEIAVESQWLVLGRIDPSRQAVVNEKPAPVITVRHLIGKPVE